MFVQHTPQFINDSEMWQYFLSYVWLNSVLGTSPYIPHPTTLTYLSLWRWYSHQAGIRQDYHIYVDIDYSLEASPEIAALQAWPAGLDATCSP